jgi:hypothetical protein
MSRLNLDHQLYLIIKRHRLGAFSIERDVTSMNRAETIKAVAADPADVAAVIEFNAVEGTSRDATSDLAKEIADRAGDDCHPISAALYEFISDHAGIDCAHGLRVFDPNFAAA